MSDDTSRWLPLLKAIELAEACGLGQHGWTWIKRWQQAGLLPMRGFADGPIKPFEQHWLNYSAQWGISDPQPLDTTASQFEAWEGEVGLPSEPPDFSIPSVGPGATSDRPKRSTLSDKITTRVRDLPPPIPAQLPTPDDMLYFDAPKDHRPDAIKVPQRVTRIQVDAKILRGLIAKQVSSSTAVEVPDNDPATAAPKRRMRATPTARLADALQNLQQNGLDIANLDRTQLHELTLKEAKMGRAERGAGERTFQRALGDVLSRSNSLA